MTTFKKQREIQSFRIDPIVTDTARAYAAEHDLSMSTLVENAIKQYITKFSAGGEQ
jgi:predicted HicB family RNase H-like nuclease